MISAYSAPGAPVEGAEDTPLYGMQKSAPGPDAGGGLSVSQSAGETLTLDRLPEGEGMEELLLLAEYSTPDEQGRVCLYVTEERLEQAGRLAQEQGINASRSSGAEGEFVIVVLAGKK